MQVDQRIAEVLSGDRPALHGVGGVGLGGEAAVGQLGSGSSRARAVVTWYLGSSSDPQASAAVPGRLAVAGKPRPPPQGRRVDRR